MNGWILYKNDISESYEINKLIKEFQNTGIEIRVVNPQDVDIYVDRDDRKSILIGGEFRTLPDFVIPRTGSGTTYFIKAIIRHLERLGVTLINGSDSIDNVKDKLYTQQVLGESYLPVPKTLLVKHPINIEFVEKNLEFPVIIKTLSGSFGAGVFLAETKKQFGQLIKMAEITKPSYNIIVQEFIKDSWGKDLRVFVLNGKVAGCMMRQATDDDFRANITRGGEGIPYQITDEIEWLGGESARLLGLDIAGVDLLFDSDGFKICEVNSSPGFEGMDKYTSTNIAENIVRFVRNKVGA